MTLAQGTTIRALHPSLDLAAVSACLSEAADYYLLSDGAAPGPAAAVDFFINGPPGCDPARSHRLGLFYGDRLSGLAELSFGFPGAQDAYLGLMILVPRLRGLGHGPRFLAHVESLARTAGAPALYLGVLQANPRGRAFWDSHGFRPTGVSRTDARNTTYRLVKPL
ncbi:MAG: GNAT family N-acetyltransferase [Pseudomonadota bacterium]